MPEWVLVGARAGAMADCDGGYCPERNMPSLKVRRPRRWLVVVLVLACVLVGAVIALRQSSPPRPGPFYAVPARLPRGGPGTIIRAEVIPNFYAGAVAYRVLYESTGFDGEPAAVSGVIVVPEGSPPRQGRKVIAFAHGTVGVASGCAPSLQGAGFAQIIEGLGEFIAAGYVVAATDYAGLGTPGPHPYLVGRVEAMNVLDSVRAAHRLRQAHAGVQFAVWGHSQGGHASLFAGQIAAGYAPGLHLVGVAAGAPIPSLLDLFKAGTATPVGRILVAMALTSWWRLYGDARVWEVLTPAGRRAAEQIAAYCVPGRELLSAVPAGLAQSVTLIKSPPWRSEPWRTISLQNSPGAAPTPVPVLLTQGTADRIVPAPVTVGFARRLCAEGDTVDLHLYPGVEHLEAGIVVAPDVAAWITARFADRAAPSTCG
jgi:alpha-beta hydrolase superfamily lysophospholipase